MNKKTLVLGVSLKKQRYSNMVVKRLLEHGHDVKAFGFRSGVVAHTPIDTVLINYKNIDTVTLYLNALRQHSYYDYIIGLHPKRIIFNPGTENNEFYKLLSKHNIEYEVACTLVLLSTGQY